MASACNVSGPSTMPSGAGTELIKKLSASSATECVAADSLRVPGLITRNLERCLPPELQNKILQYLDLQDLKNYAQVSRDCHQIFTQFCVGLQNQLHQVFKEYSDHNVKEKQEKKRQKIEILEGPAGIKKEIRLFFHNSIDELKPIEFPYWERLIQSVSPYQFLQSTARSLQSYHAVNQLLSEPEQATPRDVEPEVKTALASWNFTKAFLLIDKLQNKKTKKEIGDKWVKDLFPTTASFENVLEAMKRLKQALCDIIVIKHIRRIALGYQQRIFNRLEVLENQWLPNLQPDQITDMVSLISDIVEACHKSFCKEWTLSPPGERIWSLCKAYCAYPSDENLTYAFRKLEELDKKDQIKFLWELVGQKSLPRCVRWPILLSLQDAKPPIRDPNHFLPLPVRSILDCLFSASSADDPKLEEILKWLLLTNTIENPEKQSVFCDYLKSIRKYSHLSFEDGRSSSWQEAMGHVTSRRAVLQRFCQLLLLIEPKHVAQSNKYGQFMDEVKSWISGLFKWDLSQDAWRKEVVSFVRIQNSEESDPFVDVQIALQLAAIGESFKIEDIALNQVIQELTQFYTSPNPTKKSAWPPLFCFSHAVSSSHTKNLQYQCANFYSRTGSWDAVKQLMELYVIGFIELGAPLPFPELTQIPRSTFNLTQLFKFFLFLQGRRNVEKDFVIEESFLIELWIELLGKACSEKNADFFVALVKQAEVDLTLLIEEILPKLILLVGSKDHKDSLSDIFSKVLMIYYLSFSLRRNTGITPQSNLECLVRQVVRQHERVQRDEYEALSEIILLSVYQWRHRDQKVLEEILSRLTLWLKDPNVVAVRSNILNPGEHGVDQSWPAVRQGSPNIWFCHLICQNLRDGLLTEGMDTVELQKPFDALFQSPDFVKLAWNYLCYIHFCCSEIYFPLHWIKSLCINQNRPQEVTRVELLVRLRRELGNLHTHFVGGCSDSCRSQAREIIDLLLSEVKDQVVEQLQCEAVIKERPSGTLSLQDLSGWQSSESEQKRMRVDPQDFQDLIKDLLPT